MPGESNGLPPPLPSFMFVCELPAAEEVLDARLLNVRELDVSTSMSLLVDAALEVTEVFEVTIVGCDLCCVT